MKFIVVELTSIVSGGNARDTNTTRMNKGKKKYRTVVRIQNVWCFTNCKLLSLYYIIGKVNRHRPPTFRVIRTLDIENSEVFSFFKHFYSNTIISYVIRVLNCTQNYPSEFDIIIPMFRYCSVSLYVLTRQARAQGGDWGINPPSTLPKKYKSYFSFLIDYIKYFYNYCNK